MAAGEPETACASSFCWCLDRRNGDPKISWKASLRILFSLFGSISRERRRVDKTNQCDLGNICSTTPHFIDLDLRSGNFIQDNEGYPALPELIRKDLELRI